MKSTAFNTALLFVLLAVTTTYGQEISEIHAKTRAIYQLTYQRDSLDAKSTRTEPFKLVIGPKWSQFVSINYLRIDSALTAERLRARLSPGYVVPMLRGVSSRYAFKVFKQQNSGIISTFDKIDLTLFEVTENRGNFKWELLAGKRIIGSYSCHRAITNYGGRRWEAWYTNEIPINEGPYKFCGLPGLIVSIQDSQNFYSFQLLSIVNLENPVSFTNSKASAKPISRKDFQQAYYNYFQHSFANLAAGGVQLTADDQHEMAERIKKLNNMIERH